MSWKTSTIHELKIIYEILIEKVILPTKSFGKTVVWLLISSFYGLLPIGIIFLLKWFNPSITYSFSNIVDEGILIFFCIALSSSVTVDYLFNTKKFPKWLDFILYGFPWFLVFIASIVFSQMAINRFSTDLNLDVEKLIDLQFFIIILTLIYVIIVKTIVFYTRKTQF